MKKETQIKKRKAINKKTGNMKTHCEHQQKNPHTPRVMQSLGLPDEDIKLFCQDNLFPKI